MGDARDPIWVFYDGGCGLCHRAVTFLVARDRRGDLLRFAPLGGQRFESLVPREARDGLPDSIVLRSRDGRLRVRSEAVIEALVEIGGAWGFFARAASVIPRRFRDFLYDRVAERRGRWFSRPVEACPRLPADLRSRFDDR